MGPEPGRDRAVRAAPTRRRDVRRDRRARSPVSRRTYHPAGRTSRRGASSTATVTCWPRTSSASTTGRAFSMGSSSTIGCAGAMCCTTSGSWRWIWSTWSPDLTLAFMDWYREYSAETHPPSLEHHYIAYRALVHAKISCLRGDRSRRRSRRGRTSPSANATCSTPGCSSSSSVASRHGQDHPRHRTRRRLGWPVLRSDEIRKELAGLSPLQHAPPLTAKASTRQVNRGH